MGTYKYYRFKSDVVMPSLWNLPPGTPVKKLVFSDDSLEEVTVEGELKDDFISSRIDVSNRFSGDVSKIKNIHFIKGAVFDRDFFRRTYPNINVRNNVGLADVVIYDDRSLFQNESKPVQLSISSNGTLFSYNYLFNVVAGLLASNENNFINDHNKSVSEVGPNHTLLEELAKSPIKSKQLFPKNEYMDEISSSKKPFLCTNELLDTLPCDTRSSSLSFEELINLFEQITNKDKAISFAAAETLIMFDSKKYLPLQLALLWLNPLIRTVDKSISNKLTLFMNTYAKYSLNRHASKFSFLDFVTYIQELCDHLSRAYPLHKYDFPLMYKVIKSEQVFKKLWTSDVTIGLSGMTRPVIKVNYIDFQLTSPHFNFTEKITQAPTETAQSASINDFLV